MTRKAVVLLGGQGTRLRPFTLTTPKPLLPVANRPMCLYQLALLHECGVRDVVFSVGICQRGFREIVRLGMRLGIRVRLACERQPLGTAGAIKNGARFFRSGEPFFVFNGDILADFDLRAMERFHRQHNAVVTIGLVRVSDPSAFGLVVTDAGGVVRRFVEKPGIEDVVADTVNAGVYLMGPDVRDEIPSGRPVSVERETFPGLLAAGRKVAGWTHDGYWLDVGTVPRFLQANGEMVLRGVPARCSTAAKLLPSSVASFQSEDGAGTAAVGRRVAFGRGVVVKGWAVIGDECVLGDGCVIENSVLLRGAVVGSGARVCSSVLGSHAVVGGGAVVRNCALGDNSCLADFSVACS